MDIRISPDVVLARERGSPRRGVFVFLSVAVALITVVLLINPATTEEYAPVCGLEEHEHTEECTEIVQNLICPLEECEAHVHGEGCYETRSVLTCIMAENEEHQHTEECYTEETVLICPLPEGQIHEHTEDCIEWTETYICGLEDDPEHVHTDECVERTPVFICGQEIGVGHVHNEFCFQEETVYTCGLAAHVHTADCYPQLTGDPHADVEIDLDWESTFCNVEITGNWAEDLIGIARSQIGYRESELNFVTDEYNVRHGYTRYGDWNGTRYAGWNGLYVMFCLNYAGIRDIPTDPVPANWMNAARSQDFWTEKDQRPARGDLAFFDDDADGLADRVAIVTDVSEDCFVMISGGTGRTVEEEFVFYDCEQLAGYLALPQNPDYVTLEEQPGEAGTETLARQLPVEGETGNPENPENPVNPEYPENPENPEPPADPETQPFDPYAPVTLTAETENGITATMEADAQSLPYPADELVLRITEVENGEEGTEAYEAYNSTVQSIDTMLAPDGKKTAAARLFDISIWHKEYEEIPPVTIEEPEIPDEPLPVPEIPDEPLPVPDAPEDISEAEKREMTLRDYLRAATIAEGIEFTGPDGTAEAGEDQLPPADGLTVESDITGEDDIPEAQPEEPVAEEPLDIPEKEEPVEQEERPFTLVEILPAGPVRVTVNGIGNEDWADCRVYRINEYGEVTELAPDASFPGSVTVTTEIN